MRSRRLVTVVGALALAVAAAGCVATAPAPEEDDAEDVDSTAERWIVGPPVHHKTMALQVERTARGAR